MALCAFHYVQVLHYGAHSVTSALVDVLAPELADR